MNISGLLHFVLTADVHVATELLSTEVPIGSCVKIF